MQSITFHNAEHRSPSHSILLGREKLARLLEIRTGAYEEHEAFIRLPQDPMIRVEVEEAAKKHFSHNLKYVLVVGIGGANLGTDAIYHALKGNYIAHMNEFPKLLCMDTVAPKHVEQIMDIIMHSVHHHDEIVVNFVSKSGTTTETLLNATLIYHALKRKFAEIDQHIVVTTDAGSALHKLAEAQHWTMLPISANFLFNAWTIRGADTSTRSQLLTCRSDAM
jgi:glucose-6-phosphate isomerase